MSVRYSMEPGHEPHVQLAFHRQADWDEVATQVDSYTGRRVSIRPQIVTMYWHVIGGEPWVYVYARGPQVKSDGNLSRRDRGMSWHVAPAAHQRSMSEAPAFIRELFEAAKAWRWPE